MLNIYYISFNIWRMIVTAPAEPTTGIDAAEERNRLVLDQARAVGLLGTAKDARLSGRVPARLIEAAKQRAHVSSDTELLVLALSRLALEDDFGKHLVDRKGSIPADLDLEL